MNALVSRYLMGLKPQTRETSLLRFTSVAHSRCISNYIILNAVSEFGSLSNLHNDLHSL